MAKKYFEELVALVPEDDLVAIARWKLNPTPGLQSLPQIHAAEITGAVLTPTEFILAQNHPNPFNSITTIQYQLPEACSVTLAIYNLLGQKIKTLVSNEPRTAGVYQASWDGRDDLGQIAGSGVYVYRLDAGSFVDSRKLIMMK